MIGLGGPPRGFRESRSGSPDSSGRSMPWRGRAWTQLAAVALGVLPLYAVSIVLQLGSDDPLSIRAFVVYLAVIAPLSIALTLLLLRVLCGERPQALNLQRGTLPSDVLSTVVLSLVTLVASVVSDIVLPVLLPESAPNPSVRRLFEDVAGDPRLLALFVGPLVFLGAASEELVRVFLLSRLWTVWPSSRGRWIAVFLSSGLFGLLHLYQGSANATGAGIYGLIMALHYLRFGRVVPLILAHYLTNALQIVVFAVRVQ